MRHATIRLRRNITRSVMTTLADANYLQSTTESGPLFHVHGYFSSEGVFHGSNQLRFGSVDAARSSSGPAQSPVFQSTTKGTPDIKSIDAVGFAPGALLIGDGRGAQIFAIKIASQPAQKWTAAELSGLKDKLAEVVGTDAKGIEILKMVVDPQSNLAYVAVRKLDGKKDLVLTVDASFKIRELPLENVEFARIGLAAGDKVEVVKITDIAWGGKAILVAVQAKEKFGSMVFVVPAPLANDSKGVLFSTETYHVAHGRWETNAPIRTLMPYTEKGKNYVVGAFTCTPIVKYAIDDLQPGARVKGVSIIELGNGNTPQDMFSYEKNGKSYILMNTFRMDRFQKSNPVGPSPYWTVKVDQSILTEGVKINKDALLRTPKTEEAQVVPAFHGVMLMDRLGTDHALVVRTDDKGGVSLTALMLP